jgi:hypothetical protein
VDEMDSSESEAEEEDDDEEELVLAPSRATWEDKAAACALRAERVRKGPRTSYDRGEPLI